MSKAKVDPPAEREREEGGGNGDAAASLRSRRESTDWSSTGPASPVSPASTSPGAFLLARRSPLRFYTQVTAPRVPACPHSDTVVQPTVDGDDAEA